MLRTFQVSSELFWGYRVTVDILHFDDVKAIITYVKQDLKTFLLSRNLQGLINKLDNAKFHIHHPYSSYSELVTMTNDNDIIYICDHCQ